MYRDGGDGRRQPTQPSCNEDLYEHVGGLQVLSPDREWVGGGPNATMSCVQHVPTTESVDIYCHTLPASS